MLSLLRAIYKPLMLTLVLMLICGLAYPVLMTGLGQAFFPDQASGSLVSVNGQAVGSRLVGQDFTDPRFMKCRPSAVATIPTPRPTKTAAAMPVWPPVPRILRLPILPWSNVWKKTWRLSWKPTLL